MTDKPNRAERLKRWGNLSLLMVSLGLLLFMLRFVVAHPVGTLDFVSWYSAASIVRQGSAPRLYDLSLQRGVEGRVDPQGQFLPFDRLPFEAWLCLPLAFFSFRQAYLLWSGFNLALLGLIFYLIRYCRIPLDRDSRLVWLLVILPSVAGTVVLGQDSLMIAVAFLLMYVALRDKRDLLAGLALGLGLEAFQIVLPFAFIFLLRRRWKFMAGFSTACMLVLSASAALVGVRGMRQYLTLLLAVGKASGSGPYSIGAAPMPSLRGALAAFSGGAIPSALLFPLSLVGSILLLCWAAWEFRSINDPENPSFDLQFSFAAVAALLASYHLFAHELTPLILLAYLILGYEGVAHPRVSLLGRAGTQLLLLIPAVMILGSLARFRAFSVLFVVLFGLLVWLARESRTAGRMMGGTRAEA